MLYYLYVFISQCFFISTWKPPFSVSCKVSLMVVNYLSFCLLGKPLFLLHSWLCCRKYSWLAILIFQHFKYVILLSGPVSAKKCADNQIGVPLYIIFFFSLASFKIFYHWKSWRRSFSIAITGWPISFMDMYVLSFPRLGKFSATIS